MSPERGSQSSSERLSYASTRITSVSGRTAVVAIASAAGCVSIECWIPDLLPLVSGDDDPLGTEDLATHVLPLAEAPHAYEIFQKKEDGAIKVLLAPEAA